ncbi:MAG: hypothetical protein ABI462_01030 [Ignavibacteria bacterium]
MLIVTSKSFNIHFQNNPIALFLKQIDKKSFEDILQNIKSISGTDHLYLKIYYNMYTMFIDKSEEKYQIFKDSLYDNLKLFSKKNLQDLHYCLLVGNDSVIDPGKNITLEKLSIFDSMIRLNILTQPNGVLAEHVFMNYVNLSFQEFDIDRINTFSGKFIDKLNKNIRSNTNLFIKG